MTPQKKSILIFINMIRPKGLINIVYISQDQSLIEGYTFGIPKQCNECAEYIINHNKEKYNIYWGVNEPCSVVHGKLSKHDIKHVNFAHVDIDPLRGNYEEQREILLAKVPELKEKYKPSFIINSGNGIQLFWKHKKPVSNSEGEAINKMLIDVLNGDRGTHNVDRLMRVPYTDNYPTASKLKKGYPKEPTRAGLRLCK